MNSIVILILGLAVIAVGYYGYAVSRALSPDFACNRVAMQKKHIDEIYETLPDVRAIMPYFEREVKGIGMLDRVSAALFA